MRIGIDLDNTIVNYDHVFKSIAYKNKLINKNRTKSSLKNENVSSNPINDHQIEKLKEIRENLKNLLKL